MNQQEYFAVLTGDIVKSSRLSASELDSVRSTLLRAVSEIRSWKPQPVKGKAEFFRGDAWQLLLSNAAMALRVGVFLRASLLAEGIADSRVSIGLGTIDRIARNRVSLSTGEAFVLSGHGLDQMTVYSSMTVETPKSIGVISEWMPIVGNLCDSHIRQWTSRQAEIVRFALDISDPTHEDIAGRLDPPISKQAVTKTLNGANWYALRETIWQFEATHWESVLGTGKKRQP